MPLSEYRMSEYRIEDLAHHSGATVRTIRAYQDRGLLPKPERRGRANVYDDSHLARLHQIADLLDRGYTLASIKELLQAWDEGRGLGGVLGLVAEVDGPWTDEESDRLTRAELAELFGKPERAGEETNETEGAEEEEGADEEAVAEALALGVLVPIAGRPDEFLVPSPQELRVAAELHKAGVPLLAITDHLRELRAQVEHIAARLLDFTNEHVFVRYLGHRPSEDDATEAAELVRRLRPLAQQTVDAELARAMRILATRNLRDHLRTVAAGPPAAVGAHAPPHPAEVSVRLPAQTLDAVRELVGGEGQGVGEDGEHDQREQGAQQSRGREPGRRGSGEEETERVQQRVAEFIAAAAEREVQARRMDRLAGRTAE